MRIMSVIFLLSVVAGCATTNTPSGEGTRPPGPLPPSTRPTYNLAGYPPGFKDGYIDGCETSKGSAYGHKDAQRMVSDAQYLMGWKDGFDICRSKR